MAVRWPQVWCTVTNYESIESNSAIERTHGSTETSHAVVG